MKTCSNLLFLLFVTSILYSCKKTNTNNNGTNTTNTNWIELKATGSMTFNGEITDIVTDNSGNIFIAGGLIHQIVKWNGSSWSTVSDYNASPFTGGFYGPLACDNWGNLYCVGRINKPQANAEYHIAKWEKLTNTWVNVTQAGNPIYNNGIHSIATDDFGNVYAGGNYIDTTSRNFISKWNGTSWSVMGSKFAQGDNIHIKVYQNGIYATKGLVNANGSPFVVKWNGSSWDELGGTDVADFGTGQITSLCGDADGNIYAGGYFVNNIPHNVAKWSMQSNTWSFPPNMNNSSFFINAILSDNLSNIFAGGDFYEANNLKYVAKFDGIKWSNFGNLNANGSIKALCRDINGNLFAGGGFTNSNGNTYVAKYKP